jgi:enamine deaminase RidA (YjgF/YER057c/UK114 family)
MKGFFGKEVYRMDINIKIKDLGITLPEPPVPLGIYTPVCEFGEKFIYSSGFGPKINGITKYTGKAGSDLSLEQAQEAAKDCILNILSAVKKQIGDLNRIKKVVKILAFVASSEDFFDQPKVINVASQILIDIFGELNGKPARSAIGANVLPGNIPVEIEILFELN